MQPQLPNEQTSFGQRTIERAEGSLAVFSYAGRLVVLSIARGGRVQISGQDQSLDPPQPGQAGRESRKMFFGDQAVTVGLNAEGEAIAARAIVAWLTRADEDIERIRRRCRGSLTIRVVK